MNSFNKITSEWPPERSREWRDSDQRLVADMQPERLPIHAAIIMDGNGRWARSKGLIERIRGHEAGIESVREAVRTCRILGLRALTLYSFSKENWSRPRAEVAALMRLLERFLIEERAELMENGIRLTTIGNIQDLPPGVLKVLRETRDLTKNNEAMTLVLALSYGARDEILRAVRSIVAEAIGGRLDPAAIDDQLFSNALDTAGLPDPDLLIRTSGEVRVSNFLLWQIAYAEIYITPVLWPDFRREHLLKALIEYQGRDRRFGGLKTAPRNEEPLAHGKELGR